MDRKRRVLFIGEASYLATGFGTYWKEVISRLFKTGEFEIAEMGSYAHDNDPKNRSVPWKFYPVAPDRHDTEAMKSFNASPTNQFGEWRFDQACLDFRPDLVIAVRDFWMDEFVLRSPLRDYFKFIWMPTIDGDPQKETWLDAYKQCDKILTYSEWGMDLLKKQSRPGTNLVTVASPGADLEVFTPPQDKAAHKQKLGLDPRMLIVGTVMRNQKRKLYYDLIEAFSQWIYKAKTKGHTNLARRAFLYLHTSYPDVGYDIGRAVREFDVGNKVLMTYLCSQCGVAYPAPFAGEVTHCRACRKPTSHPPNASHQVPRDVLANIMKTFDLYVQYSISEGWGMPLTEAMACGVPTMAVKYSAMEDHLKCPTSIAIEVQRFFYEAMIETEQRRALPSNQDFVNKLDRFLKLSDDQRAELSRKTREYVDQPVKTYGQDEELPRRGWERTAAIWYNVIKNCEINDEEQTWLYPKPRLHEPDLSQQTQHMDNTAFVRWVITSIWERPDWANTYFASEWVTALNTGFKNEANRRIPVNRNTMVEHFVKEVQKRNTLENRRVANLNILDPEQVNFTVL